MRAEGARALDADQCQPTPRFVHHPPLDVLSMSTTGFQVNKVVVPWSHSGSHDAKWHRERSPDRFADPVRTPSPSFGPGTTAGGALLRATGVRGSASCIAVVRGWAARSVRSGGGAGSRYLLGRASQAVLLPAVRTAPSPVLPAHWRWPRPVGRLLLELKSGTWPPTGAHLFRVRRRRASHPSRARRAGGRPGHEGALPA